LASEFGRLDQLVNEARDVQSWWHIDLDSFQTARQLLGEGTPEQQLRLLLAAYRRLRTLQAEKTRSFVSSDPLLPSIHSLRALVTALLRRKLPFDHDSIRALVELAAARVN